MKLIGVTGGIGSGKTTMCKFIESLGYDVYYSDVIANLLIDTDSNLKEELINEFGEETYVDGVYNRKFIANIIFSPENKDKLDKINEIFKRYLNAHLEEYIKDKTLVFYESALIFEFDIVDRFDKIICVYANPNDIRKRLKLRNNFTDEEIDMRLNNQLSPVYKAEDSDYVVDTTDLESAYQLISQILMEIKNSL